MSERYGLELTTKKAHMKWRLARNNNTVVSLISKGSAIPILDKAKFYFKQT